MGLGVVLLIEERCCFTDVVQLMRLAVLRNHLGVGSVNAAPRDFADDYVAYRNMFSQHQLCWAHLIRKAIKLALRNPDQSQYAEFLDGLCSIYGDGKPTATTSRGDLVKQLQDRVTLLCNRRDEKIITAKAAKKFEPAIEPTNNRSERNVRREAEIRKGARTSKTNRGAKRRGTIVTVLASLQTRLARLAHRLPPEDEPDPLTKGPISRGIFNPP